MKEGYAHFKSAKVAQTFGCVPFQLICKFNFHYNEDLHSTALSAKTLS